MTDLTPENLAEPRRLLDDMRDLATREGIYNGNRAVLDIVGRVEPLLDAAAERDRLREAVRSLSRTIDRWGLLIIAATHSEDITTPDGDGDWQVIEERLAEVPDLLAERDALATDRDALRATMAGRCLSGITHRDEEHRQSVCMLPEGHAPLMHDDCMGCTWTDADHWQPSAVDRVADEVQRIADESRHEGWDPLVRILVGRISAALEGAPRSTQWAGGRVDR